MATEEDGFVLYAFFSLAIQVLDVFLEAPPLQCVSLLFCPCFICPLYESKVLFLLGKFSGSYNKEGMAYEVKLLVICIVLGLLEIALDGGIFEMKRGYFRRSDRSRYVMHDEQYYQECQSEKDGSS